VCAIGGPCRSGRATALGAGDSYVINTEYKFLSNGALVRGSAENVDLFDTVPFHVMGFELDSGDFFGKNPNGHITVAARAYFPYSVGGPMVNGYPEFTPGFGVPEVPYAMGSGIILGVVPCGNLGGTNFPGTVAIEHFLRPFGSPNGPSNRTHCPLVGATPPAFFADNTTYHISVAVKRGACPGAGTCQWVGYLIERKSCSGFGCTWVPVASGGGGSSFPDTSAADVPAAGWSRLFSSDRSSWFLGTIFSRAFDPAGPGSSWTFQVRSLVVEVMSSPPSWWIP